MTLPSRCIMEIEAVAGTLKIIGLARTLHGIAAQHLHSVMPAHTHTQPAQPTTLAHYLAAVIEMLLRDASRLRSSVSKPSIGTHSGACAITTTGFPIDRAVTTELSGFNDVQANSFLGTGASPPSMYSKRWGAMSIAMIDAGKFIQDLLLVEMRSSDICGSRMRSSRPAASCRKSAASVALEHGQCWPAARTVQARADPRRPEYSCSATSSTAKTI